MLVLCRRCSDPALKIFSCHHCRKTEPACDRHYRSAVQAITDHDCPNEPAFASAKGGSEGRRVFHAGGVGPSPEDLPRTP